MTRQPDTAQIRQKLDIAFDDPTLTAFCLDYFPKVYDSFGEGMRKDRKITLLLDYCRRHPTGFEKLLEDVRKEYTYVIQGGLRKGEALKLLIKAIEVYLDPPIMDPPEGENGWIYALWLLLAFVLFSIAILTMDLSPNPQDVKKYFGLICAALAVLIVAVVVVRIAQDYWPDPRGPTDPEEPPSPYIVGPPILSPPHFFGRKAEVDRFFNYLNGYPQPLQVLGISRSGKTSFLRYVSHPDVICKKAHEPAKTLVIYIDLQADIKTVADFYTALGEGINGSLPGKPLALPKEGFPTRATFVRWLKSPQLANYRLIILLDEFEALREEAGFDSNFFKGLRVLVSRRLAWVTISYRDLYRLSRDLGESEKTSPFFNIFHPTPIILGGFSTTFADALIQKPAASVRVHFSAEEIVSIQQLAGRLPFFLQMAAEMWFYAKQHDRQPFQIKAEVKQKFARATRRHFQWYWRHFDEHERLLLARLATETPTESLDEQHRDTVNDLLNYGLITQEGERYRIASEVFAEWIRQEVDMALLELTKE